MAAYLFDEIKKNKRNTWILIFCVTVLMVIVGYVFGQFFGYGLWGLIIASVTAFILVLSAYYGGDKLVLATMGAEPADYIRYRQLHNVVEEMAIAAGIPKPAVYVIDSAASNAFATGRDPQHASVAITTGLMDQLNREELQGVIGHEMSHVRHYDIRFSMLMAVLVGTIALMCDGFWRTIRYSRGGRKKGGGGAVILVLAILLAILAPLAAYIIQYAMSRKREYLADAGGAELTRNPLALANALQKIAGDRDPLDVKNRGAQHLFIISPVNPLSASEQGLGSLFMTHPPIEKRINILREMAHTPTTQ